MGTGLFAFRYVDADDPHGLSSRHFWDGGWRVPYKKAREAVRLGRPGDPVTLDDPFGAIVYQVGPHAWVGYCRCHGFPDIIRVGPARTMNKAIDALEQAEVEAKIMARAPQPTKSPASVSRPDLDDEVARIIDEPITL